MRARLNTCMDVNIMPASVYKLVFHDPNLEKLTPNKLQIGTYTNDTVKIVGTCKLYLVHLDTKKLVETIFYVAINDGSVLLSCKSTLTLNLIQSRSRLDYLPPREILITNTQDHPKKTKQVQVPAQVHSSQKLSTQSQTKEETSTTPNAQDPLQAPTIKQIITSKDQIIKQYPVPIYLKEAFKKEIDKMLQVGVLKPVTEATPGITSIVLVESKDKARNHKLGICLDPTNLKKAIIREPYHLKTLECIAHLIAGVCTMSDLDCCKGYWHQQLDEQPSYLATFNTQFGRYRYTVMPFGATVAGDVFQLKLDECFGHIPNVMWLHKDLISLVVKHHVTKANAI